MDEILYDEARKRVKQKKSFYGHLGVYTAVGVFFLCLNVFVSGIEDLWWYIPLIPWGLGLTLHYISVFGLPFTRGVLTKEWEDKETERELRKLNKNFGAANKPIEIDTFEEAPLKLKEIEKMRNYDDSDLV